MIWPVLKGLQEVYELGKTKKTEALLNDRKVRFLLNQTRELIEGVKVVMKGNGFDEYYRNRHLANYLSYNHFLTQHGLMKPQLRFGEDDIRILMDLHLGMQSGELLPIRNEIIHAEETVRGVSQMFFKNEKHLMKSESLTGAVKKILGISELANDRDQQYIYVLKAHDPKSIVLCENLDFLKRPSRPRKYGIELWYAGGKNIDKLDYMTDISLPIFYSCDWDYDGLMIYQTVKQKIPSIQLLTPNGTSKSIIDTEHKSLWRKPDDPELLSGLNPRLYSAWQIDLIKKLMKENEWVIEESNNLINMVSQA